jgi:hypothetical protein
MPYAWLTPDNAPDGTREIILTVPNGDEWEAIVRGALVPLCFPDAFEQRGSYTPDETAAIFWAAIIITFQWLEVP